MDKERFWFLSFVDFFGEVIKEIGPVVPLVKVADTFLLSGITPFKEAGLAFAHTPRDFIDSEVDALIHILSRR